MQWQYLQPSKVKAEMIKQNKLMRLNTASKTIKLLLAEIDEQSRIDLEKLLPYKFEIKYAHHITIDWDVPEIKYLDIVGQKFDLEVDTLYFDDKIEAIGVDMSKLKIQSINKNPHITWSGVLEVHPYYSNYMVYMAKNNLQTQSIIFPAIKLSFEIKAYY
jgi:Fungal tRNA ligase phosphodiesterase domain